jgi:dolichyl-phosphate beta-glucosyltransferase
MGTGFLFLMPRTRKMMMRNSKPNLTIVIPAYKEEKRIGKTLDILSDFLSNDIYFRNIKTQVLVVSANSSDRTHYIVKTKLNKFKNCQLLLPGDKLGKGRDVQFGMLAARAPVVIFMDADLATPISHLKKFYITCSDGANIVIATRNLKKHHNSAGRRFISNIGNFLFRIAGGIWVEDSQCGFKMFSQNAIKEIFPRLTIMGWGFDMEVLTIAKIKGIKIETIRINDWKNVDGGTFENDIIKNTMLTIADLYKIILNRIIGRYN